MDLRIAGKAAIVTGGSGGIGRAVANSLLQEGVSVVIAARNILDLQTTRDELISDDRRVYACQCDTTNDASVDELVGYAVSTLGSVDILVNAAAEPGAPSCEPDALSCDPSQIGTFMEGKLSGYLRCAQAASAVMAKNQWGRIVNVGGTSARSTGSLFGSVRNAGVVALTKNLADALGPHGIAVTAVHPGLTRTRHLDDVVSERARREQTTTSAVMAGLENRTILKRLPTAEDIANVITFLCSPLSAAINGDSIAATGGSPGPIYY